MVRISSRIILHLDENGTVVMKNWSTFYTDAGGSQAGWRRCVSSGYQRPNWEKRGTQGWHHVCDFTSVAVIYGRLPPINLKKTYKALLVLPLKLS